MAKRSIEEFDPVAAFHESVARQYYSDEEIDRIIKAGGGPPNRVARKHTLEQDGEIKSVQIDFQDALKMELETFAHNYSMNRASAVRPTPAQLKQRLESIQAKAKKLLIELDVGINGKVEDMPSALRNGALLAAAAVETGEDGEPHLQKAIEGVQSIWRLAKIASEQKERSIAIGPPYSRQSDHDIDELFCCLIMIWGNLFEKRVTTSYDPIEGTAGGPLINFIRLCLEPLDVPNKSKSPDAIRERVKKVTR